MRPCNCSRPARSSLWPRFFNLSCVAARDWVVNYQATQHLATDQAPPGRRPPRNESGGLFETKQGSEIMRHLSMRAKSRLWSNLVLSDGTATLVASAAQAAALGKECGKTGPDA